MVVAAVVGAVVALWWIGAWETLWELFSDRARVRRLVEDAEPLAPVVYVLLLVAQAVLAPCPQRPWPSWAATSSAPSGGLCSHRRASSSTG